MGVLGELVPQRRGGGGGGGGGEWVGQRGFGGKGGGLSLARAHADN